MSVIGELLTVQILNYLFKFTVISDDEVMLGYDGLPCSDDYIDSDDNIIIPSNIIDTNNNSYHVRSIGSGSFFFLNGYKFIFPDSIEKIEMSAFELCTVNILDLSATNIIELPQGAFQDSISFVVKLPECIESIGDNAFKASMISEFVAPSQLKMVGVDLFKNAYFLISVDLSPSKLISIPKRMFEWSSSKIILPDTIILIGNECFFHSISIPERFPKSLQVIEEGAFQNIDGNANIVINLRDTNLRVIGPRAFTGNPRITSILLPDTVEEIGESAFDGVPVGQTDYSQMSKLKILGPRCFAGSWIKVVNLSTAPLKEIGEGAFDESPNLDEILLPTILETISPVARNCPKLVNIEIPNSIKNIIEFGFSNLTSVTKLFLSHIQINTIPSHCFSNCPKLSIITLPTTTISISSDAFTNLSSLTRIFACGPKLDYDGIPNGVTLYTSEKWSIPNGANQIVTSQCSNTDPETLIVYGTSRPNVLLFVTIFATVAIFITFQVMIIVFTWKAKIQTIEEVSEESDENKNENENENNKSKRKNRKVVLTKVPRQPHHLAMSSFGRRMISSSSSFSNLSG